MTSKLSFSSLRRENTKHRIGMISVVLLCLIISIIGFIISVQNIYFTYVNTDDVLKEITALSEPAAVVGILSICAGVIMAASGFHYLHSKVETDFYHSLPIKRRDLLFVILTNDFLFYFLSITLTMLLRCAVVACVGCFNKTFFVNTVTSVICYFVMYLASYLLMALVMLITGNTFTAFLGFGVLASYFPVLVRNLYPVLAGTFYQTYCTQNEWGSGFEYLSPISVGLKFFEEADTWTWAKHRKTFLVLMIWILLLLVVSYFLSEKRKSEMAGKSIAFPNIKPIIRIMLVIPLAIYTGVILANFTIDVRKEWILIGIIIGTFLFHGMIECIYRFDVRGFWVHKKQMVISVCASLLIVGFFWFDLSGYDRFLPKESELDSMIIHTEYVGEDDDCYWGKGQRGVTGETLENALITIGKTVKNNDKNVKKYMDGEAGYCSYVIEYRMKDGRNINVIMYWIRNFEMNS